MTISPLVTRSKGSCSDRVRSLDGGVPLEIPGKEKRGGRGGRAWQSLDIFRTTLPAAVAVHRIGLDIRRAPDEEDTDSADQVE